MLYVDIPTSVDISALAAHRGDMCVSIYLRTTPVTQETQADRIELKNLAKHAVQQLRVAGANKRHLAVVGEQLDDLIDDDEFWRFQAHSLAIFATPENLRTFRVPNALESMVAVSDRFHLKPLLRTISFPHACYVLALAQRSVRLIEVSADLPAVTLAVDGLPENAGRALRGASEVDHWPSGRIQDREGQKVLLRQFARNIDRALRALLTGSDIPLVLAATEPLLSIYRSVNTYAHLADLTIEGSPDTLSEAQLDERARIILDGLYHSQIDDWSSLFEARSNQGRATTDLSQAARAATIGAVESMLVDIDRIIPGQIDASGAISFAERAVVPNYGLLAEIASRVLATGGRVIGVRKADIPRGDALAAILRYPA